MKWLGPFLLICVFLRHDTSYLMAGLLHLTPGAWFTIMGGLLEIILCSLMLLLLPLPTLAVTALWIGILEGAQIAACRPFISDISRVQNENLCDYVTGWPVGYLMTFAELGVVGWAIAMSWPSVRRS